uniref:CSON013578 protein n=1 Tax=Culicoides sonorensis TaxID=179676 RepID=A0A336KS30_CULSO
MASNEEAVKNEVENTEQIQNSSVEEPNDEKEVQERKAKTKPEKTKRLTTGSLKKLIPTFFPEKEKSNNSDTKPPAKIWADVKSAFKRTKSKDTSEKSVEMEKTPTESNEEVKFETTPEKPPGEESTQMTDNNEKTSEDDNKKTSKDVTVLDNGSVEIFEEEMTNSNEVQAKN